MLNLFRKKNKAVADNLSVDIHSHLLPGLDDGVDSFEQAIEIIKGFEALGYKKLITTPHIMPDFYRNSETDIRKKLEELKIHIREEGIDVEVLPAAEYYLDESLLAKVQDENYELLTFGNNYLLFETAFMNEPFYLKEFVFAAKARGINPVMAHPERYAYMHTNPELIDDLLDRGVLLQVNINSFTGYYSKDVKKSAEKLIDKGTVHFLGSDCHNMKHFNTLQKARTEKYYLRALELPLINHNL